MSGKLLHIDNFEPPAIPIMQSSQEMRSHMMPQDKEEPQNAPMFT